MQSDVLLKFWPESQTSIKIEIDMKIVKMGSKLQQNRLTAVPVWEFASRSISALTTDLYRTNQTS